MDENSNAAVNLCEFSQDREVLLDRQAAPPKRSGVMSPRAPISPSAGNKPIEWQALMLFYSSPSGSSSDQILRKSSLR